MKIKYKNNSIKEIIEVGNSKVPRYGLNNFNNSLLLIR